MSPLLDRFAPPRIERLAGGPLITSASHAAIGDNLNGPCVIRVPDWVRDPPGRFLLYFAHHTGDFIRLAVAGAVAGPWRVVDAPCLHLRDTDFAQSEVVWRDEAGETVRETPHIASPDVHVDAENRRIVMLFHGLHGDGRQTTANATSQDGVTFFADTSQVDLAPPYLRLCRVGERYLGIAWGGALFSAPSLEGPFVKAPPLLERPNGPDLIPRHPALVYRGGVLHCFYSLIGDRPERIWHLPVLPAADWRDWEVGTPRVVLTPERDWEGARRPVEASRIGEARGFEHALRDPYIFEDYLFYVAGGESALAVARMDWP